MGDEAALRKHFAFSDGVGIASRSSSNSWMYCASRTSCLSSFKMMFPGEGIAFITYTTPKGAKAAIKSDGKSFDGQAVTVQAKGSKPSGKADTKDKYRVFV